MFTYPQRTAGLQHGLQGYAVVDLETTGFDALDADRIVEVAIVRIDAAGRELGTFSTLIHPGCDMRARGIHHIDDAMVSDAPTFAEIASSVLAWLEGVVVVAHNAPFEDAFLTAEFTRAGWLTPSLPAVDTLALAQSCVPTPDHKLGTVCAWAGLAIHGPHTALGDARATAQMLPHLLRRAGPLRWREPLPRLGGRLTGRYRPREAVTPL